MNDITKDAADDLLAGMDHSDLVDVIIRASARLGAEAESDAISILAARHPKNGDPVPALHAIVDEAEDLGRLIVPRKVEWEMDWSGLKEDGTRRHPDKPEKEMMFEEAGALALLLINEVIHLNSHHWEDGWPAEARRTLHLGVDCSDAFAWGCSDSEGAGYADIESVYRHWIKDRVWGPVIWCMIKRREMPQRPVEKRIRDAGIWDLDALQAEHGLRPNHYDGISRIWAVQKYEAYCAWERSQGAEPLPQDATWWEGWRRFVAARPDWHDAEWKAEEDRRRTAWRLEHGHEEPSVSTMPEPIDVAADAMRLANMIEAAAERRRKAAAAVDASTKSYFLQTAAASEREVLESLPALLAAISRQNTEAG